MIPELPWREVERRLGTEVMSRSRLVNKPPVNTCGQDCEHHGFIALEQMSKSRIARSCVWTFNFLRN